MSVLRRSSASHLDDAAELAFGSYVNHLSEYASQVELLLARLSGSVPLTDARLEPLLDAARKLVEELRSAAQSKDTPERDLAVTQLLPSRAYRAIFAAGPFEQLPDRLDVALFGAGVTAAEYGSLALVVDDLNTTLQRNADSAVAG